MFGGEIMTFVVILLCAGRIDAQTRIVPGDVPAQTRAKQESVKHTVVLKLLTKI